jgi:hypothetical protein
MRRSAGFEPISRNSSLAWLGVAELIRTADQILEYDGGQPGGPLALRTGDPTG